MIPLAIAVLLAISAVCSATETAFSSVNRIRLKNLAASGSKSAKRALKIIDNFDKALTAILIGNNIVNLSASSLATVFFTEKWGSGSVGIATLVMTVLVLTFGEILPKCLAKENSESFSLAMAPILSIFMTVLTPIIAVFSGMKRLAVKLVGSKDDEQPSVTEEELKYIIDEIEDEGVLEEQESNLVKSALEFDEITIGQVLVPRINVVAVAKDESLEDIKNIFVDTKFSRLPVYEKTIDNIIGIMHQSDFFELYLNGGGDIADILKKPVYVSENKRISEGLRDMQKVKVHMAVVIDAYGGTEGICTLEDIIEELVGEIYDESDEEDTSFIRLGDNRYQASAELSVADFLEKLNMPEDTVQTECTSVGGWIMELLGRVPRQGESLTCEPFEMTVIMEDDQKIDRVNVYIKPDEEENKNAEADKKE